MAMDIVYLDQNKWIDLARIHSGAVTVGPVADVYHELVGAVQSGRALFPLSVSHILETSKRNDPVSRGHLVQTQAKLSRGFVYRSRAGRLEVEIRKILCRLFNLDSPELPKNWAIAPGFLQAFEPTDTLIASADEAESVSRINAYMAPADQYVDYMMNQDDNRRRIANARLSVGMAELVKRIEDRRTRLKGEAVDLRRRVYAVELFIEHQELFLRILKSLSFSFDQLSALGDQAGRALIEEVPTLDVESRMAARLEAEAGSVASNDVFDMQSFYTAVPYSSWIVAEKAAISRAKQAKLDTKYQVKLSQSLTDLLHVYL